MSTPSQPGAGEDLAAFLKKKDSPPPWAFFPISAFYCEKGLLSFFVQSVVDVYVRLRHGKGSVTAQKLELTCLVRQVSGLLMRSGVEDNLEQAEALLRDAQEQAPAELCAPVFSLQGKVLLFHRHPPQPGAALAAYERAREHLWSSPYCAVLSQPHHLLFGAAMAAVLQGDGQRAGRYFAEYEAFAARHPKKRWGPEIEEDLRQRIRALGA